MPENSENQESKTIVIGDWSPSWWDKVGGGSVLMIVLMWLLFVGTMMVAFAGNILLMGSKVWNWSALMVTLCLFVSNGRYALALYQAGQSGEHPSPLAVALRRQVLRMPIRLLASCWWGVHVCMMMGVLFGLVQAVTQLKLTTFDQWWDWILLEMFAWWLGYCSVGYLLLAVASWPVQPEILLRVWFLRTWLSLLAMLVGFVVLLIQVF